MHTLVLSNSQSLGRKICDFLGESFPDMTTKLLENTLTPMFSPSLTEELIYDFDNPAMRHTNLVIAWMINRRDSLVKEAQEENLTKILKEIACAPRVNPIVTILANMDVSTLGNTFYWYGADHLIRIGVNPSKMELEPLVDCLEHNCFCSEIFTEIHQKLAPA